MEKNKNDTIRIGYTVFTLQRLISRSRFNSPAFKNLENVTGTNGWIIKYLYDNRNERICQRDIEKKFSLRRSSVSKMLDSLQEKGYIERVTVPDDARLKSIVLTEKAYELHKSICDEIDRNEQKLTSNLTKEELESFKNITDKIKSTLEEDE